MGSTVLTGKAAAAFARPDGTIIYAAFERTYEKNCYPHQDHWGCIAIGQYQDVMRRIFVNATSVESGMLQSRAGHIKPENYIAHWRQQLAKPQFFPDKRISLQFSSSFYAALPDEREEDVQKALAAAGQEKLFDLIKAGDYSVSLHDDFPIIELLYGRAGPLAAWRLIKHDDISTGVEPNLGFTPALGNVTVPLVRVYRLDRDNLIVQVGSGRWSLDGWTYRTVGNYITDHVYGLEMQCTGASGMLIKHFRDLCNGAEPLPPETIITVNRAEGQVETWYRDNADKLAYKVGVTQEGQAVPSQFTCRFADVVDNDALYELRNLTDKQIHWNVPDSLPLPSMSAAIPEMQLDTEVRQQALF